MVMMVADVVLPAKGVRLDIVRVLEHISFGCVHANDSSRCLPFANSYVEKNHMRSSSIG